MIYYDTLKHILVLSASLITSTLLLSQCEVTDQENDVNPDQPASIKNAHIVLDEDPIEFIYDRDHRFLNLIHDGVYYRITFYPSSFGTGLTTYSITPVDAIENNPLDLEFISGLSIRSNHPQSMDSVQMEVHIPRFKITSFLYGFHFDDEQEQFLYHSFDYIKPSYNDSINLRILASTKYTVWALGESDKILNGCNMEDFDFEGNLGYELYTDCMYEDWLVTGDIDIMTQVDYIIRQWYIDKIKVFLTSSDYASFYDAILSLSNWYSKKDHYIGFDYIFDYNYLDGLMIISERLQTIHSEFEAICINETDPCMKSGYIDGILNLYQMIEILPFKDKISLPNIESFCDQSLNEHITRVIFDPYQTSNILQANDVVSIQAGSTGLVYPVFLNIYGKTVSLPPDTYKISIENENVARGYVYDTQGDQKIFFVEGISLGETILSVAWCDKIWEIRLKVVNKL